jgi:hypothetical protein
MAIEPVPAWLVFVANARRHGWSLVGSFEALGDKVRTWIRRLLRYRRTVARALARNDDPVETEGAVAVREKLVRDINDDLVPLAQVCLLQSWTLLRVARRRLLAWATRLFPHPRLSLTSVPVAWYYAQRGFLVHPDENDGGEWEGRRRGAGGL